MGNEDTTPSAAAVSVKLPIFYIDDPVSWFKNVEAQFVLAGINNSTTKFYHIIVSLGDEARKRIPSKNHSPSGSDPYNTIKKLILETFSLSTTARLDQLRDLLIEAESYNPNEIHIKAKQLLDGIENVTEALADYLVVRSCPPVTRGLISNFAYKKDEKTLLEAANNTRTETSVSAAERSKSPRKKLCFYHRKFGIKARKCEHLEDCPKLITPPSDSKTK